MSSYLQNLIDDVDSTHFGLGRLIAVCQLAVKARKLLLIIAPTGCGKSAAIKYVAGHTENSLLLLNVSVAGLRNKADFLTSFRSVIGVEDIASINTTYGRTATFSTLASLCYDHRIEPSMNEVEFSIEDFQGSALVGIQPRLLKDILLEDVWASHIKDKATRYYHLIRPVNPELPTGIVAQFEKGLDLESVRINIDTGSSLWKKLQKIGSIQWGRARTKENLTDYLKAVASLEHRTEVIENDYEVLYELLKPLAFEDIALTNTEDDLDGVATLNSNLINLLSEYYTYGGKFSIAHICQDFQRKMSQVYNIMSRQNGYWQQVSKSPTIYKPTELLMATLKQYDLEVKEDES